ncbi:MAG TPA: hypothetical protein VI757_07065 [Bacteroidia bacterium]|nr:hypothetical protein [Bacteroidia bacterium]
MKSKILTLIFLSAILFLNTNAVRAQDANLKTQSAHNNFIQFIGIWEADAVLTVDGKQHNVRYHINFRKAANGKGLYADEWFNDTALGNMKGANLIGYDPYDSKVHWYSVDNMGTTHEHIGDWTDSDTFYMEHNGMRDGKKYAEKIWMKFNGKDEMEFKLHSTLDGKESYKALATFHRKSLQAPEKKQ